MPDHVMPMIGRRLRDRRRLVGLTQQRLGEICGVSFQQIHKYETGAVTIAASRLWLLATALGVSVGYFFEGMADGRDRRVPASEPGLGGD
jgi:transcriptional regulator with XRE-family HTH domain